METRTYETLSEKEQSDLMSDQAQWYSIAETGCQSAKETMLKCEDFNNGDQWDTALKEQMEASGKYVSTTNVIRAQVNQFTGNIVSNPKDITSVNTHGGFKLIADLNTALFKHTMDINDGINKTAQWFHRGGITGRSFIAWFKDMSRDPINGDLSIKVLPEFDCVWDHTCLSYDLNGTTGGDGAKYFFWNEAVDQDWANGQWPELKDKFPKTGSGFFGNIYHSITRSLYGVVGRSAEATSSRSTQPKPDTSKTRYILRHCWWVEYKDCWYWYDNRSSELEPMIIVDKDKIKLAKDATKESPELFKMVKSIARVVHHTRSIGGVFIDDTVDEFNLTTANLSRLPIIQFCPSHSWGRTAGIVEDMIGPQEAFNWFRTQVISLLKGLPNSGWIVNQDINGSVQKLKRLSSEINPVINKAEYGGVVEKIDPNPFPAGLDALAERYKSEIREVSNIRTESPEKDSEELSGRAILAKQANSQVGTNPHRANFDWSLKIFGAIGIDIIRCSRVYSDDEIKGVIEDRRLIDDTILQEARYIVAQSIGIPFPQPPADPNPEIVQAASPQLKMQLVEMYTERYRLYMEQLSQIDELAKPMAIQQLIEASRNPVAGRYHTSVSLSPYSVTQRLTDMANLIDTNQLLITSGYKPLPERDIIESSDLPHKERILQERGAA